MINAGTHDYDDCTCTVPCPVHGGNTTYGTVDILGPTPIPAVFVNNVPIMPPIVDLFAVFTCADQAPRARYFRPHELTPWPAKQDRRRLAAPRRYKGWRNAGGVRPC